MCPGVINMRAQLGGRRGPKAIEPKASQWYRAERKRVAPGRGSPALCGGRRPGAARCSEVYLAALAAVLLLAACAGPFNQVTPCVINCAVTLNGSPATAQQPASVTVHRQP